MIAKDVRRTVVLYRHVQELGRCLYGTNLAGIQFLGEPGMELYGYPEVLDYDLLAIEGFRRSVFRVNEPHFGFFVCI